MTGILILQPGKKKAIISPENENGKCLQYAATVALCFEEIVSHPERTSNIILFVNICNNWEKINYPSKIDDWKTFKKKILQLLLIFCILKK